MIVLVPAKRKTKLRASKSVSNKSKTLLNDPDNIILENNFFPENTSNMENVFDKTTHSIFPKKSDALLYIDESGNEQLKLFCEDICEDNGSKRFIVSTYDNIYQLSKTKKKHMYEYYENDQELKLILDIDYKIVKSHTLSHDLDIFDDLLVRCIDTVNNKLKKLNQLETEPIIIILKSCREDKLSAHIIYTNVHFKNIVAMKCFMMTIVPPQIDQKVIDPNIYRVGCMRLIWNSKLGKSNILEYDECKFMMNNNYTYENDYQLFMDCLLTNIHSNSNLIIINLPDISAKVKNNVNIKYDIETIKQYLDLLDTNRASDYNYWISTGMAIYNANSSINGFKLWDNWSKSSDKYNGSDINMWKWNTFNDNGALTIATLKYYAKTDNPNLYDKINHDTSNDAKYTVKTVTMNYLLERNENIKDQKSLVTKSICEWYEDNDELGVKTLAIKSAYNTGKSAMIGNILTEFNPKTVLFITHHQSSTNKLYGTFKKHKVCNYLNDSFDANRLICQVESLYKILDYSLYYNNDESVKVFDLVIMDKIELILYHFMSPTIVNKQQTFELMVKILSSSKKILALDGDFHNRSYDFICRFGKNIVIHNNIIKNTNNHARKKTLYW